jgi:hypothetical protein
MAGQADYPFSESASENKIESEGFRTHIYLIKWLL